MKSQIINLIVRGALVAVATTANASAADLPLLPRIAGVEFQEVGSPSNSTCGGTGYDFPLAAPRAVLSFQFVPSTCAGLSDADCIAAATAATTCVDVCFKAEGVSLVCPGESWCDGATGTTAQKAWVVYSKAANIGALGGVVVRDEQLNMENAATIALPAINLGSALTGNWTGVALVLRVNKRTRGDGLDPNLFLPESGASYIPERLATSPLGRFEVWGNLGVAPGGNLNVPPTDVTNPFLSDVCTRGAKEGFGPTLTGRNVCLTAAQADRYARFFEALDGHQFDVIQRQTPQPQRHVAWTNGGGASCRPTRAMFASHTASYYQEGLGRMYINPDGMVILDPTLDPYITQSAAVEIHNKGAHEFLHNFQTRWSQESPAAAPHISFLKEEHADSVANQSCLALNPASPGTCISAAKLIGATVKGGGLGVLDLPPYELTPSLNALFTDYSGGAFQLYASEQFSYPLQLNVPTSPHPSGVACQRARPDDSPLPTSPRRTNDRNSDEGFDLLGLLYRTFDQAQPGQSTQELMDQCFQANIGRSLVGLVTDFHTALFLKDYNQAQIKGNPTDAATAARWRFEWDGDGNSAVPSETLKPNLPPDAAKSVGFGHQYATRVLDSYGCAGGVCPSPSTRVTLPFGGVLSGQYAATSSFGAAAWSVQPQAGWIGSSVPFVAAGYGPAPRFRAFAVQKGPTPPGGAKPTLVPVSICGSPPDYLCPTTSGGAAGWQVATAIPVDANTDEVLIIASGFDHPTASNWAIGKGVPSVKLVSPSVANPIFVGHPSTGKFPLFATAVYSGPDQAALPIQPSTKVEIEVQGCANGGIPGGCKLTNQSPGVTIVPLSGGTFMVLGYLPASFYPPLAPGAHAFFGLQVSVDGVSSNVQPLSVTMSAQPEIRASSLVLDNSHSMEGVKLAGLKVAAKAIVGSLVPAGGAPQRWLNIVTFSDDASTLPLWNAPNDFGFFQVSEATKTQAEQAIDAITTANLTSIGDGMFEAQSNMACKFQPGVGVNPPVVDSFQMYVLSDGLNTAPSAARTYYQDGNGAPTGDGNGDWCATTLQRYLRVQQGLQVPTIHTIAFGQDADKGLLDAAALATGGEPHYAPDGASTVTQAMSLISESMLMSMNDGDGTQRVLATTTAGGSDQIFYVESGATELRIVIAAESIPLGVPISGNLATLFYAIPGGAAAAVPSETRSDGAIVLKVLTPPAGAWLLRLDIPQGEVFVEAAVVSPTRLVAIAQRGSATTPDGVATALVGHGNTGTAELRATVFTPTGSLHDCVVFAGLLSPTDQLTSHQLFDDGKSSDGGAGDGVFGSSVKIKGTPGIYAAYFASVCNAATGEKVWRQASRAFLVQVGEDTDADGMPDAWEKEHALNPTDPADAAQDLDNDGLSNLGEYAAGTNPQLGDSDNGGEADGSEVAAGRDPLSTSDDAIPKAPAKVVFGKSLAGLWLGGSFDNFTIHVQTWTPSVPLALSAVAAAVPLNAPVTRAAGGEYVFPVTSGVETCMQVRLERNGAYGPWGEQQCATPGSDTSPPVIQTKGEARRHGRWLRLTADVTDEVPHRARGDVAALLGISTSGSLQVRVGASPTFGGAPWQPYAGTTVEVRTTRALRQRAMVWIQARDAAGNLSAPQVVSVASRAETLVDRAITLEEDAIEEASERVVKKRIRQSVVRLKLTESVVRHLAGAAAVRGRVRDLVDGAVSLKSRALVEVGRHNLVAARASLESALTLELELAVVLDQLGGPVECRDRGFEEDGEAE